MSEILRDGFAQGWLTDLGKDGSFAESPGSHAYGPRNRFDRAAEVTLPLDATGDGLVQGNRRRGDVLAEDLGHAQIRAAADDDLVTELAEESRETFLRVVVPGNGGEHGHEDEGVV